SFTMRQPRISTFFPYTTLFRSSSEKVIPSRAFPRDFYVHDGKSYRKDVITFHIPVSGNLQLPRTTPSTRLMWTMPVDFDQNEIRSEEHTSELQSRENVVCRPLL